MRKILALAVLAALCWSTTADAAPPQYQTNIPGVIAPGEVVMVCDANSQNCQPASAAAPLPVLSAGGVPSGSADSGNPVKVGGVYNTTSPTLADGQRGNLQLSASGSLLSTLSNTVGIPINTTSNGGDNSTNNVTALGVRGFGLFYNGTTWDRVRGDATGGAWVQGGVASGAADAGNPVKVGGVYTLGGVTLTDGQRGNLQLSPNGSLVVAVGRGFTGADGFSNGSLANVSQSGSTGSTLLAGAGFLFNGASWDRSRGDATGGIWTQGAIASGATDTGNPVKVGGRYNAALPTLADGQRGDLQLTSAGTVLVTLATSSGGTGLTDNGAADGKNGTLQGLIANARNFLWNGATWDRTKKPNAVARLVSAAASTNATLVKASAGDVFHITSQSVVATARWLKLYNKGAAPTVGTDVPVMTFYLPANAQFDVAFDTPVYFSAGIAFAITAAGADADATAIAAGDIVGLNVVYQ